MRPDSRRHERRRVRDAVPGAAMKSRRAATLRPYAPLLVLIVTICLGLDGVRPAAVGRSSPGRRPSRRVCVSARWRCAASSVPPSPRASASRSRGRVRAAGRVWRCVAGTARAARATRVGGARTKSADRDGGARRRRRRPAPPHDGAARSAVRALRRAGVARADSRGVRHRLRQRRPLSLGVPRSARRRWKSVRCRWACRRSSRTTTPSTRADVLRVSLTLHAYSRSVPAVVQASNTVTR